MSESKRAVITGASGQDALLLSEYLIEEHDYEVWAVARRAARPQSRHVNSLLERYPNKYHLVNGDITDITSILRVLELANPQELYNLAAQSHVGISFKEPLSTYDITQMGAINCMEAVRAYNPFIRVYQASSSEMFGGTKKAHDMREFSIGDDVGQMGLVTIDENTPLHPMSPYGVAKVAAHSHARLLRDAYGMHISCGILFNHESELRKPNFVTRKVTAYCAMLADWVRQDEMPPKLKLGCLDFARDWGCAKDYVRGMHLMLQQDEPGDYVLATGQVFTGPDLLDVAFQAIGINDWSEWVELDPTFERPSDVKVLLGDASMAKDKLGWEPRRHFHQLITDMVKNDIEIIKTRGAIDE